MRESAESCLFYEAARAETFFFSRADGIIQRDANDDVRWLAAGARRLSDERERDGDDVVV